MKLNRLAIVLTCMMLCLGSNALAQTKTSKTGSATKARTTAPAKTPAKKNATARKSTAVKQTSTAKKSVAAVKAPASDLTLFGVKGKVKSIKETEYNMVIDDPETMVAKLTPFNTMIYTFTEDGFLSGVEQVITDPEVAEPTYKRDASGKLLSYTKQGWDEGEPRMETTVFKRNAAGHLISINTTDAEDKTYVVWNRKITLLPDGKVSKIKNDTEYDSWTEVYKYNAAGDLIKKSNVSPLGSFSTTYKYKSARDANGNWIKRNTSDDAVTVREIEYYQ